MKNCHFCTNNIKLIDYKDTENIRRFLNTHARIIGKRRTSVCAKHQRQLALAIKRARFLSLLPFLSR
ncbi:MAG: 30S ribosomal protein S18 [Candidatus Roizmanbacteria bacterium]|nr:30S ribosomal protein S18 [Candidatus Roizmanbacteria bacterium]